MKYKPELLAPAGNLEKLKFAFIYGADAAYIGGKDLSLRCRADNFSFPDLAKAVKLAVDMKKDLYLAINMFFRDKDFVKLGSYCDKILKMGLNRIIVADFGALNFIQKQYKNCFHVSMSTQSNITNSSAINLLKSLGVKRVIPARELSLKELREIKKNTDIELETFIHGAMCVSYSGRCLLSEYMAGRNANKGDCTHSCRWNYHLMEEMRPGEYFPVFEDKKGTRILSSKDLCTISILPKLIEAGIDSFKIEGRMKSLYYTANVTRVYKQAIDHIVKGESWNKKQFMQELNSVSHRPYFEGFYFPSGKTINHKNEYERNYKFAGYLEKKIKNNLYRVIFKDKVEYSDKIEIILPDMKNIKIREFTIYDRNRNRVDKGIINKELYIELDQEVSEWGIIRKLLQ